MGSRWQSNAVVPCARVTRAHSHFCLEHTGLLNVEGNPEVMVQTYLFLWLYTSNILKLPSNFRKCYIWAWEGKKEIFIILKKSSLGKTPEIRRKARMKTCHRLLLRTVNSEEAGAWLSTELGLRTLTLAETRVPVKCWRTLLHTGPILEDVAVHALQAVCPQRPAACTATPITLCKESSR